VCYVQSRPLKGRVGVPVKQPANTIPDLAIDLHPGVIVAEKYRLVRTAGLGGMAAVWVAKNEATGAEVALKMLMPTAGEPVEAAARFRREAHTAAQLTHRGIVRVFDLIELEPHLKGSDGLPHAGTLVMVMELLRGETLASRLEKNGTLPLEEALDVVFGLLSAIGHAHASGIIHRDLKPENVFLSLDSDGLVTPKILDFGISKTTHPKAPVITTDGALMGTPSYMSPEQARGWEVDERSDLFAVGILFYEMVSGKNPFASGSYHTVVAAILEREPDPLTNIPREVWDVVHRCLVKSPEHRFRSARECLDAFRVASGRSDPAAARDHDTHRAPFTLPARPLEKTLPDQTHRARRRVRKVVAVTVTTTLVLFFAGAYAIRAMRDNAENAAAQVPSAAPSESVSSDAPSTSAVSIATVPPPNASAIPPIATAVASTGANDPATHAHHPTHTSHASPVKNTTTSTKMIRDPGF
jgi:serine/threonine protein kinase